MSYDVLVRPGFIKLAIEAKQHGFTILDLKLIMMGLHKRPSYRTFKCSCEIKVHTLYACRTM